MCSEDSPDPDWAKTFLRKGAAGYVSATGYAYGDTELTEYGERLFLLMAQQLRTGNGPVSIGQAVVKAKQQYLAETAQLTGIDQKTLVEMTLYGLPMMKVDMPGDALHRRLKTPLCSATTPVGQVRVQVLGAAVPCCVEPSGQDSYQDAAKTYPMVRRDNHLSTGDGWCGRQSVQANLSETTLQRQYEWWCAGGAALRAALYRTQVGNLAADLRADHETSTAHLSYNTNVFYPTQTWASNYYDAIRRQYPVDRLPGPIPVERTSAIDGTCANSVNWTCSLLPA